MPETTNESSNNLMSQIASNNVRFNFLNIGFHGDLYLLELVDSIMGECDSFIETGANVGSTLAYVARKYPHIMCFSCEPDKEAYFHAIKNTEKFENVSLVNEMSQNFIRQILNKSDVQESEALFWLDAHGYGFQWPLLDEVKLVTSKLKKGFVLIDDFLVPDLDCFGYDEYEGQVCSYDYIKGSLCSKHEYNLYYPSYTDKTSKVHPLRGWALLEFGHETGHLFSDNLQKKIKKMSVST